MARHSQSQLLQQSDLPCSIMCHRRCHFYRGPRGPSHRAPPTHSTAFPESLLANWQFSGYSITFFRPLAVMRGVQLLTWHIISSAWKGLYSTGSIYQPYTINIDLEFVQTILRLSLCFQAPYLGGWPCFSKNKVHLVARESLAHTFLTGSETSRVLSVVLSVFSAPEIDSPCYGIILST